MSDNPFGTIVTMLTELQDGQIRLSNGFTRLSDDLTRLQDGQTRLSNGFTRLSDDVTRLRDGQTRLSDDVTRLRVDLMARMERQENRLGEIRDDISVVMGSADAMKRANENTRDIVRLQGESLSVMWRQIKQLQTEVRELKGEP
jgi:uncharacterized phage infection (PIP) family protein YhgE